VVSALISNITQVGVNIQIYSSSLYDCRMRLRLILNGRLGGPRGYFGSFGEKTNPCSCRRSKQLFGGPACCL